MAKTGIISGLLEIFSGFIEFMYNPDSIKGYDPPLKEEVEKLKVRCDKCGK